MQIKKLIPVLGTALLLSACSSTKDISYFQDLQTGHESVITALPPIKLRPNDKVSIIVSTSDQRLNSLFNLPVASNRLGGSTSGSGGSSSSSGQVAPYTIDSQGDIEFPVLGKLHIAGMSREQVAEYIRRELISRDLAKNPIVTVDFLNLEVSVMGEVGKPGRVAIPREDFTILDAISSSGDLTIFGRRDNIRVLREENGVQKVYSIDLNSGKDLTNSPVYYLQQNDVVYVEPNATKARQSTANGNSWLTPTFWISIASFATTIALLFIK
jgi:polysaccharide export protein